MTDRSSDPYSATSNLVVDYDGLLSGSQHMDIPSVDYFQAWQGAPFLQPMTRPSAPVNSSCPAQHVASGDGVSAYSLKSLNTGGQSLASFTSRALQSRSSSGQDLNTFPQNFNDINFGAFHMDQSSLFASATFNASTTASPTGSPDSPFTGEADQSSSGASTVLSSLSCARPQPGTISDCRQDPSKGMRATSTCPKGRQSCLSSALETLQALHIPPTACLSTINETRTLANKRRPRKTDSVLATNRTAVRQISESLQCSCICSSQVQLVLISICDKIIAWYRAISRHSLNERQDGCADPDVCAVDYDSIPDNTIDMASERVLHQRFAFGEYSLDSSLENKLRARVIAFELQQLEDVISNLSNRLQKENHMAVHSIPDHERHRCTLGIDSSGLLGSVHGRLIAHLRRQLQDTKAEIAKHE